MSYYNQQQPPVGVPPPQGYPPEGYPKDAYPPPGYPPQGYPPPGYPPQYGQPPPQQQSSSGGFMEGWRDLARTLTILRTCAFQRISIPYHMDSLSRFKFGCSLLLLPSGCLLLTRAIELEFNRCKWNLFEAEMASFWISRV
ncbi:hypothetical protein HHK36_008278 [Tetracentron sinense]|uniref:Rhodopsin n=1 Tax=Tetracentron sinense TaxID=13715 RepID=A0A834ZGC4_TETSI|nr:hypothetical protein HHK36_008278 [Tetracentron sinense]